MFLYGVANGACYVFFSTTCLIMQLMVFCWVSHGVLGVIVIDNCLVHHIIVFPASVYLTLRHIYGVF